MPPLTCVPRLEYTTSNVLVGYRLTDSQVYMFMHAEYNNFSTCFIYVYLVTFYGHILSDQSDHLFLDI